MAYALGYRKTRRHKLDRGERFAVVVTQCKQCIEHVVAGRCRTVEVHHGRQVGPQLSLEFQQQALGGLLADAGNLRQAPGLLHRDRLRKFRH